MHACVIIDTYQSIISSSLEYFTRNNVLLSHLFLIRLYVILEEERDLRRSEEGENTDKTTLYVLCPLIRIHSGGYKYF